MATQRLTEETECGYCYSRGEFLTDPRELPCHHVYCLPCVEGHYSEHGNLTCAICKEVCLTKELDRLPKVEVERQVTRVTCDGYKCQGQTALTHCIECGHNMCITHIQAHQVLYGDSHKDVPIGVFETNPERFGKPVCEYHGEVLVRACKKCDKLICVECDMDGRDCTGLDTHQFKSLQSLREEVNSFLKDKLQSVEDKIEELVKLDKDVWKDLDKQEEKCDEIVEEIKRVRDEQIKRIQEESEALIKKVYDHQVKVTNQVEELYNKVVAEKDKMEELKLEIYRLLRDGHVTERIRQKERITEEFSKHVEKVLGRCQLTRPLLVKKVSNGEVGLNLGLVQTPSSLMFISKHETGCGCFLANHREDGDILIGADNGVHLLSRDGKELTKYNTDDVRVSMVIEYHQNIYILHRAGNICKVDMCLPGDMTRRQELLQFERTEYIRAAAMAVSDGYLVVNNPDTGQLIIYDFITRQTETVLPTVYLWDLHFLPDGQLLGVGSGKLIKYRIENGKLSTVWTCEGLVNGNSVCADSDGLIYVSTTYSKQTVYIISPQGVRVNTLTYDQLPVSTGHISVRDGVLAVPGWGDKTLHLFKINRGDNSTDE